MFKLYERVETSKKSLIRNSLAELESYTPFRSGKQKPISFSQGFSGDSIPKPHSPEPETSPEKKPKGRVKSTFQELKTFLESKPDVNAEDVTQLAEIVKGGSDKTALKIYFKDREHMKAPYDEFIKMRNCLLYTSPSPRD